MNINGYTIIDSLRMDNSGTARWGFAQKDDKTFFIKEFLSPSYPSNEDLFSTKTIDEGIKICKAFENNKRKLYKVLSECNNGGIIAVNEFFRYGSKYYTITEKVDVSALTPHGISNLSLDSRIMICKVIAHNISALHKHKIIHADLKPDNILIKQTISGAFTAKIIDFDNSFFVTDPPQNDDLQGDTVYLAPEAFLYMSGELNELTTKMDIFSLGIIFCQYITGSIPEFDHDEYDYLYSAVLDGGDVWINDNGPDYIKKLIIDMISKSPDNRPSINQVFERLDNNEERKNIETKKTKEYDNNIVQENNKKKLKKAHGKL